MKTIFTAIAGTLLLTACTVSGPKVKVEPPGVKIKPVAVEIESEGSRSHCPPGHAKKNWC